MASDSKTSEEFDRFTALVDQVMAVPRSELDKRQEEYLRSQETRPMRPGPKRKADKS